MLLFFTNALVPAPLVCRYGCHASLMRLALFAAHVVSQATMPAPAQHLLSRLLFSGQTQQIQQSKNTERCRMQSVWCTSGPASPHSDGSALFCVVYNASENLFRRSPPSGAGAPRYRPVRGCARV